MTRTHSETPDKATQFIMWHVNVISGVPLVLSGSQQKTTTLAITHTAGVHR